MRRGIVMAMGCAMRRGSGAAIIGDSRGRHFGVSGTMMVGSCAAAPTMGPGRVGGSSCGLRVVSTGTALGVGC